MVIDFQQHYTPPELFDGKLTSRTTRVDKDGNPNYLLNPLLCDLRSHVEMMDHAGIDMGVLSCGLGFDQPDLAICREINDAMREAELLHPGRFIGLAHAPALQPVAAAAELRRCAIELGFPGVVIASEMQDQSLDSEAMLPFWKTCADLGLYVFIHPLPRVIGWKRMDADDLGRMLGWEFSLMVAVVRIINSGLLDKLPELRVLVAHFGGGIGRYRGRINGLQQRNSWGTEGIPRHGRSPRAPFEHYLDERLLFDSAGWAGPDPTGGFAADWVGRGLSEIHPSRCLFASDWPQAVHRPGEVIAAMEATRALGTAGAQLVAGLNADKLIRDLPQRFSIGTAEPPPSTHLCR
jgi:predicted TIM-barrel fold metal-dependent hydrolase